MYCVNTQPYKNRYYTHASTFLTARKQPFRRLPSKRDTHRGIPGAFNIHVTRDALYVNVLLLCSIFAIDNLTYPDIRKGVYITRCMRLPAGIYSYMYIYEYV
jgi:hypothetical protein